MGDYLSWNLISPVYYLSGQELQFELRIQAPDVERKKKNFYVVGALYTEALDYISDSLFYIFVPPGASYGGGDAQYATAWELEPNESMSLLCQLTLNRSGVVLGLFLYRVEGDTPSISVDEQVDTVSVTLIEKEETMANELTTTITSPQVVAAGGVLTGDLVVTSPSAGNFYLLMKQFTAALAFIPGSRAYLYQLGAGVYKNSTTQRTTRTRAAAGVVEAVTVELTLPNTDCYLYLYLKKRASNVVAGAFVVGTTYEIMSIGTTDFTLVGATANTVGLTFAATGVGAGTGTAAELPDPDTDDTVDNVVITIQSTADVALGGIDLPSLMNLMITMMIVMMMMKMMVGIMKGE